MKATPKTETRKYLVDTNIILEDVKSLFSLYENGKNAVIITDVVLNELESKKTLQEDIGFNARWFFRAINGNNGKQYKTIKGSKVKSGDYCRQFKLNIDDDMKCKIYVISRTDYNDYSESGSAKNDMKISEIANDYKFSLVTNDIAFKMKALSKGIEANSLHKDEVSENIEDFHFKKIIELKSMQKDLAIMTVLKDIEEFQALKNWSQIQVKNLESGNSYFGIKINGTFVEHNFNIINQQLPVQPKNAEQKFMFYSLINTANTVSVVSGSTGSGKNVTSLLAAIYMMSNPKKYDIDGIIYMRNTVTANDKEAELGFRKGGQDEKLGYFMYPLYSSINFILENASNNSYLKKSKGEKEAGNHMKDEATSKFMEDFNVQVMDIAHARGITISKKIVIIDETQNMSNSTMKLLGTRLGEKCRLIILGDPKQVDHPYLSKNRNALMTMLKKASESDFLAGIKLEKTIRSKTAEWFDQNL